MAALIYRPLSNERKYKMITGRLEEEGYLDDNVILFGLKYVNEFYLAIYLRLSQGSGLNN